MANKRHLESIERIVSSTCHRDRERGFAIDSSNTVRPEDTVHARMNDEGILRFTGSVVEVGLLDPYGESVSPIAESLKKGDDPNVELPRERGSFSYKRRCPMPSVSIVGILDPETGYHSVEVKRTRVFSRRFKPECPKLIRSEAYKDTMRTAQLLGNTAIRPHLDATKKDRARNANAVVSTFAGLFNSQLTRWAIENDIPQIMRHYPMQAIILGREVDFAGFTAEKKGHAGFEGKEHARSSTPCTELETWINMVNITSYFEHNEPAINQSSMELIADWLTQRKIERLTRNEERRRIEV